MLRVPKAGVLVVVIALGGLLASSASAANWHTNGIKAFTSTDAGAWRLVIHSTHSVVVSCPSSSISGTVNGPTNASLPWLSAATVTPVYGAPNNCTANSVPGYTYVCGTAELRANAYTGGDTLATAPTGLTHAAITGLDCTLTFMGMQCATVTGSVNGEYINPHPIASGTGRFTMTTAGQALTVVKSNPGCAAIPHGTGTVGVPVGTGIGDTTYTIHGPNAPYMYRGT